MQPVGISSSQHLSPVKSHEKLRSSGVDAPSILMNHLVLTKIPFPKVRVPFWAKPGQIIDVNLGAHSEPLGGIGTGGSFNSSPLKRDHFKLGLC